ncbi:MAG TPA: SusC/RagA family TonB-linked outer membrane protein, partial [Balneolaceae bacterium]|nr:SusC/RagA family TonB-linked outer membrane protein [Balneolaceae bacterium]
MINVRLYKKSLKYSFILFMIICSQTAFGQTNDHSLMSFTQQNKDTATYIQAHTLLKKALARIEKKYNVVFLYKSDLLKHQKVAHALPDEGLSNLLKDLFKSRNLSYKRIGSRTYGIIKKKKSRGTGQKAPVHQVQGTVTQASNGKPLPAVNVVVQGTSTGTTTDKNGHYSLGIPSEQDTLVFSYIGYKTKKVPVRGRSTINVKMKTTMFSSKQLVVIGYGSQQQENVNGAVSTVSSKQIKNIPEVSVTNLLQGQAAGVTVTHNSGMPGAASSVHIRGITSINGNNQPLYIIDGVPVSGDANNTATSGQPVAPNYGGHGNDTVSPLSQLDPNDIKSITVLKDASAEAIYGSRGANGVVLITTKKGQAGQSHVSYNGTVSEQEPVKYINMMNLRQYARLQNALANVLPGRQPREIFSRPSILGNGTNWQKSLYRHALKQSHHLAFSGGNKDINYYIAGGYSNQNGIVIGSKYKRYTINTKINAQVNKWLKAGVNLNGSTENDNLPINGSYNGAVNLGLLESPEVPVYKTDGSFAGPGGQSGQPSYGGFINPIARALSITNTVQRNKLLGNLYAKANLLPGLTFKSSFSGNIRYVNDDVFTPTYKWGRFTNNQATSQKRRQKFDYWDWKNYFTYKHTFPAENQITWLVGQEAQRSSWEGVSATGVGYQLNSIHSLSLASTPSTIGGFKGDYTMASYYTRLIYSFEQKYGLTASFRTDGSSKFDQGHRWGYFPAVAAHWDMYKEPWMKGFDNVVNRLTLKAGYGITGNQDIGNFLYTSTLRPIQTGFGTSFAMNNISNPELTWERQKQLNLGVNFGFLNDRLNANVEVYNKVSDNFLFALPLPNFLKGGPGYQGGLAPPT